MSNIDECHDAIQEFRFIKRELLDISSLLHDVGLERLGTRLDWQIENMNSSLKNIEQYVSDSVSEKVRDAQESTLNMIKTAIAVAGQLSGQD